jgi:hypothetical protein
MRNLTPSMVKAITEGEVFKFSSRLFIYDKRIYFHEYDGSLGGFPYNGSSYDSSFISYEPLPQAYFIATRAYDSQLGYVGLLNERIDANTAWLMGYSSINGKTGVSTAKKTGVYSRVDVAVDNIDGLTYMAWLDKTSGTYLRKLEVTQIWNPSSVDMSFTFGSTPAIEKAVSFTNANVKMFSGIAYQGIMYMYIDDGAIRCGIYEPNYSIDITSPTRIVFPTQVAVDADLIYTAMVSSVDDGKCIFYATDAAAGCVYGLVYNLFKNTWSDVFVAVPSDLSAFKILGAMYEGSKYCLYGQFGRQGASFHDYDSSKNPDVPIYNMLMKSIDGKIFSLDKTDLVSTLGDGGYIFINEENDKIIMASLNRYAVEDNIFELGNIDNVYMFDENTLLGFEAQDSSGESTLTIGIANGQDQYSNSAIFNDGNLVELYVGLMNDLDDFEWTIFGTYEIIGKARDTGTKNLTIYLRQWGMFELGSMNSPFYFEIQSKLTKYDSIQNLDNLYVAPEGGIRRDKYFVDFWNFTPYSATGITAMPDNNGNEGGGCSGFILANTATKYGIRSTDIKDQFLGFVDPALTGNLQIKVYGWSYSSVSSLANPTIGCSVRIKKIGTGEVVTVAGTASVAKFPQYYPDTETGDIPLIFDFTMSGNYSVGDQLLYVIMTIQNASATGTTTTYLERAEIVSGSLLTVPYKTNTPWTLDEVDGGMFLPAIGRNFMMFSNEPYSSFNFNVQATFDITKDATSPVSDISVGLVGLAEDEDNCIIAMFNKSTNYLSIRKFRNAAETILDGSVFSELNGINPITLMFSHSNGNFKIRYLKAGNEWSDPLISYDWTAADGYLAKPDALMHVGVCGSIIPAHFWANTFSNTSAPNMACIDDLDDQFQYFPSSGVVSVEMLDFAYKTKKAGGQADRMYGPFQPRSMGSHGASKQFAWSNNGIQARFHRWDLGSSSNKKYNADIWNETLISANDGYTWQIFKTQWRVATNSAGTVYDWGRGLFYSKAMPNNCLISLNSKCFIAPGLMEITAVNGDEYITSSYMTPVYLKKADSVKCVNFFAATDDENASIKDMISKICKISGTTPSFSGDLNYENLTLEAGKGFPLL